LLRGSSGKQARLRPASPPPGRHHLRPADSAKRDEAGFLLWDTAAFLRAGVGRTSCPPLPRRTPPRAVLARRHVLHHVPPTVTPRFQFRDHGIGHGPVIWLPQWLPFDEKPSMVTCHPFCLIVI
jgi:hypothetical protein